MKDRGIFWDASNTLGFFSPWSHELEGRDLPDYLKAKGPAGIKHGIKELLEKLSSEGWSHYVTTTMMPDYAEYVMERAGLGVYFDDIFARDVVGDCSRYDGKHYEVVVRKLGLDMREGAARILAIGDRIETDTHSWPSRTGIVLIHQNDCAWYDSVVLERIIDRLVSVHLGDINTALHTLNGDETKKKIVGDPSKRYEIAHHELGDIKFDITPDYPSSEPGRVSPILTITDAENYRMPLTPVD